MNPEEWKRQRKWTLVNCCVGTFWMGLSFNVYYPTEYYYFKVTMKLENADIYYGLSWACLYVSGIISSILGGYYADKTKNVREIMLYSNLLNVVGNIMYVLYYSPYVVLLGQFLCGTAAARAVAGFGEIARLYTSEELTQKVTFICVFGGVGNLLGPCLTYLFKFVDTHVGDWQLNIGNVVGIVMASIYLMQYVLNFFTMKNLSKEYNLKRDEMERLLCDRASKQESESPETREKLNEEQQLEGEDEASFLNKYLTALLTLRRNKHALFLYGLCFFSSYLRATVILLWPIKASYYFNWTQTNLATFRVIVTVLGSVPSLVVLSALSKLVKDFYFLVFTLVTLILGLIFMALLPIQWGNHTNTTAIVFLYASGITTLMSSGAFHVVSRTMLAKFAPENIQTATEGIRNSLTELSCMVAGLCVKLSATYMSEFMVITAVIMVIVLTWLFFNAERYKNIEILCPED